MNSMDFFNNCTNDLVVYDALEHEHSRLLESFKQEVHRRYKMYNNDDSRRDICQENIKRRKWQLRKLKALIDYIKRRKWQPRKLKALIDYMLSI